MPPGLAAILDRRVTRRYAPDPVPEPLLQTVLAAAQSAPSKSDLQQYSIIVLQDAAKIARIADWIGAHGLDQAGAGLPAVLRRHPAGRRVCELHGRAHANDNVDTFINATADAALALGFTVMAAEAAGLGTCPISYVRNHVEKIGPMCRPAGRRLSGGRADARLPGRCAQLALAAPAAASGGAPREPMTTAGWRPRCPPMTPLARPAKPRYPEIHGAAPEGCTWSENAARQTSVPERFGLRTWLKLRGLALD